ncbi:diguanylate cyclase domain-containing protein [Sphingomonas sp. CJ20]
MFRTPRVFSLFWLIAGLILVFQGPSAHAQTGMAGKPLGICILPDTGGMNPALLIHHPERFDCTSPQYRFGYGDFWVISSDIDAVSSATRPLSVRTSSTWLNRLSLHILYSDGRMESTSTGSTGVTPLIQLGAIVEQTLPTSDAPVERVLWHVEGAANVRGILLGPRLATAAESADINLQMAALYAAFAGLCIALIMYNLALWAALRHPFQLHYCVMVACLLAYAFTSSGAMAWVFPAVANNDRLRLNYLLLGATGASALIFARSFFEPRIFAGWLDRYARGVSLAMFGSGVLFFVGAPLYVNVPDALFTLSFLGLATVIGPMLWRAWRRRSNYLWLFALGWGAPILMALLRTLSSLHVLPWSFWLDNSTILSSATEALMSAVAIAYRIRLLRDERDDAIASEVMARRLADTDPLTGLLNRRAFLDRAIGRPGEQVLLIADLDHFKRVNETLGHDGGDEVLRVFARILRSTVPAQALVSRMGGEEFAILTTAEQTVEPDLLLARLRAAHMPFDLKVTASIGVCRGPIQNDVDWKALYRGADSALFDAKSAGRDRARAALRRAA